MRRNFFFVSSSSLSNPVCFTFCANVILCHAFFCFSFISDHHILYDTIEWKKGSELNYVLCCGRRKEKKGRKPAGFVYYSSSSSWTLREQLEDVRARCLSETFFSPFLLLTNRSFFTFSLCSRFIASYFVWHLRLFLPLTCVERGGGARNNVKRKHYILYYWMFQHL